MAQLPKEMAEKVGASKTAGGGNYIQHGDYILLIKKWFYQQIQDRCIITEFLVIDAKQKAVYEGGKEVVMPPNAVGSDCSTTINFDGAGKLSAEGNARAMVLGLFGFSEGAVPNEKVANTLQEVCDEVKQPAKGMLIACSTFSKEIQSRKGSYITGYNWSCVDAPGTGQNAPDKVAARAQALAQSPEDCVRLACQQLGKPTPLLAKPALTPPTTTTVQPPSFATPELPAVAAPSLPSIPVVDPLAGWTQHPQNPEFYYKGSEVKRKQELLDAAK